MAGRNRYYCLVCKKLADKDTKKGFINKYYLPSLLTFDTKREIENHLKRQHPKEWVKITAKTGDSK